MNPATTTGTLTTPGSHAPVTVIGLGLMGSALASALLAAGHRTTVWNRTSGRADALVGQGAEPAVSLSDALAASPIVIACVSTYDVLRELISPVADALQGRTLSTASCTPWPWWMPRASARQPSCPSPRPRMTSSVPSCPAWRAKWTPATTRPTSPTLDVDRAALGHIVCAAERAGLETRVFDAIRDLAARAVGAGHGGDSFSAVVDVIRGHIEKKRG